MKLKTLTDNQLVRLYRKYYGHVQAQHVGGCAFGMDYRTLPKAQSRMLLALNTEMRYRGIA